MRPILAVLAVTLPLFAWGTAPAARATLRDGLGKTVGSATFTEVDGGVRVVASVVATPGPHGFHIHAVGKCSGPDFKSAGGHFNPGAREHGLENVKGAHSGDMPNLVVLADGTGKADFVAKGATLGGGAGSLFQAGGTAVVLHAAADDLKSDPAGNAGDRVACGVIER